MAAQEGGRISLPISGIHTVETVLKGTRFRPQKLTYVLCYLEGTPLDIGFVIGRAGDRAESMCQWKKQITVTDLVMFTKKFR